jgi:fucose permease
MGDYISGVHKQPLSNPYSGLTLLIVHATKIIIFIKKQNKTKQNNNKKKQKKHRLINVKSRRYLNQNRRADHPWAHCSLA